MSEPTIKYKVGDRVKVGGYYAEGYITVVDQHDPYVAYKVQFDDKDYDMWVDTGATTLSDTVTLTREQAEQVREALEAMGWDDDDLGPLAAPKKPAKVIRATITLPDDSDFGVAINDVRDAVEQWEGTIEYEN